jgi:hypothetical protein
MDTVVVTAARLNLRRSPHIAGDNLIASLPQGQLAEVVDRSDPSWWKIQTQLGAVQLSGFSSSKYLKPEDTSAPLATFNTVSAIHYALDLRSRLDSTAARHSPLSAPAILHRDETAASGEKERGLRRIVDALDVEHSARYQPTALATYCNIYAYDYCYFAGAYLPRVWWTAKALIQLSRREPVAVAYDKTVHELNANALFDWLSEWGDDFGWSRVFDLDHLQHEVNEGSVAVICARRREAARSGHITCVVPETSAAHALRNETQVLAPAQSQAGARNKKYFSKAWWIDRAPEYSDCGFFLHA